MALKLACAEERQEVSTVLMQSHTIYNNMIQHDCPAWPLSPQPDPREGDYTRSDFKKRKETLLAKM